MRACVRAVRCDARQPPPAQPSPAQRRPRFLLEVRVALVVDRHVQRLAHVHDPGVDGEHRAGGHLSREEEIMRSSV